MDSCLSQSEMQTASFRIWTWLDQYISFINNRYAMLASFSVLLPIRKMCYLEYPRVIGVFSGTCLILIFPNFCLLVSVKKKKRDKEKKTSTSCFHDYGQGHTITGRDPCSEIGTNIFFLLIHLLHHRKKSLRRSYATPNLTLMILTSEGSKNKKEKRKKWKENLRAFLCKEEKVHDGSTINFQCTSVRLDVD